MTWPMANFTHVDEGSLAKAPENPSEPCMAKKVTIAASESAAQY